MRRIATRLGELDCYVVDALPEGASPELAVVLCHGYAAPATDLVSLAAELTGLNPALAGHVRFVFPAAPIAGVYGMPQARAWFPVPPEILNGQMRDWSRIEREVPEGLPEARRALMGLVSALSAATKLPYGRIVLGGFSQGSWVTTDVALRLEEAPAGLCILSGTLLCQDEWRRRAATRKGLPVLQGHGHYDDLLPFGQAERLRDLLTEAGLAVEFVPFDGPHTIDAGEMKHPAAFLGARLGVR